MKTTITTQAVSIKMKGDAAAITQALAELLGLAPSEAPQAPKATPPAIEKKSAPRRAKAKKEGEGR